MVEQGTGSFSNRFLDLAEGTVVGCSEQTDKSSENSSKLAADLAKALDIEPWRVVFKSKQASKGGAKHKMTFEILGETSDKAAALVKELNAYKAKSLGKQLSESYSMNIGVRVNSLVGPQRNIYDTLNQPPPDNVYKDMLVTPSPATRPLNTSFNERGVEVDDHAVLPEKPVSSLLQQQIACEFHCGACVAVFTTEASALEHEANCVAARRAAACAKDSAKPHANAIGSQTLEGRARLIEERVRETLERHQLLQHRSDVSGKDVKDPRLTSPQTSKPQPAEVSGAEHAAGVWQREAVDAENMLQCSKSNNAETLWENLEWERLELQRQAKERQARERAKIDEEIKLLEMQEWEVGREEERDLEEERKKRLIRQQRMERQMKILELRLKLEQKVAELQMAQDMDKSPRAADLPKFHCSKEPIRNTGASIVQCEIIARRW